MAKPEAGRLNRSLSRLRDELDKRGMFLFGLEEKFAFEMYSNTGCITGSLRSFLLKKGWGPCRELDGCAFPISGVHKWSGGWMVVAIDIPISSHDAVRLVRVVADSLEWDASLQAPATIWQKVSNYIIADFYRLRKKVAAFRAA